MITSIDGVDFDQVREPRMPVDVDDLILYVNSRIGAAISAVDRAEVLLAAPTIRGWTATESELTEHGRLRTRPHQAWGG
jgi:hypothetical protein